MTLRTWSVLALLAVTASAPRGEGLPLPPNPRYAIQHLGVEQGLAAKTITSLTQDSRGFLWVGTQSDGFFRYDGASFERVTLGSGQRDNYAHGAVEAKDGRMWLVTAGSTGLFDGGRVRRMPGWVPAGACALPFSLGEKGRVFLGKRDGLYDCEPTGGCRRVWPEEGGKAAEAQAVATTVDRVVWFASGPRLFRLSGGAVRPVSFLGDEERVDAIVADPAGGFWVRTAEHLYRGDADGRLTRDDDGLPRTSDASSVPIVDRGGTLWVPTALGLFRKVDGAWRGLTTAQGLTSDSVTAVGEDGEGALWVGLSGNGLDRWPGRAAWCAWTPRESLPSGQVWCFLRDPKGRLFLGTDAGLFLWDGQRWRDTVLGDRVVQTLVLAADGAIWAQGRAGTRIARVDPETLRASLLPLPPGLEENDPLRLVSAPAGSAYVTSRNRLFKVSLGPDPTLDEIAVPLEPKQSIGRCIVASDGTLWCSTSTGLLRRDARGWRLFSRSDGVDGAHLSGLASSRREEIWFTYTNQPGVTRLSAADGGPSTTRRFTSRDGLPSDISFGIYVDGEGSLWDGGNSGLGRIRRDGSVRDFRQADGLIWDDFNSGAFLAEADGTFLFGTSRGVARYDPSRDTAAMPSPPVLVTAARLGARDRLAESGVSVPWRDRSFVVRFSGLTFRSPDRVRFSYRLHGLQEEAVETSSREVRFDSLPAGRYRFEVTCRSAAGAVSARPATFSFRILPPWWQTLWFRTAALALVLLATSGVTTLAQRARTRRLVAIERVRTRIATDLHDDLGSSLTEISIVSGVLEKRVSGDPEAVQLLAQIGQTSRGLTAALSDCIWSVDPRKDDLGSLIERLRQFARDILSGSDTTWRVEGPEGASEVALTPAERRGIFLLVKEALHNVVKHAAARDVRVTFRRAGRRLEVDVVDDGKGFAPGEVSGEGHGLRSMAARAESLGGTCRVGPGAHGGTHVAAVIPLEEA